MGVISKFGGVTFTGGICSTNGAVLFTAVVSSRGKHRKFRSSARGSVGMNQSRITFFSSAVGILGEISMIC
jgi:hypothetical protein